MKMRIVRFKPWMFALGCTLFAFVSLPTRSKAAGNGAAQLSEALSAAEAAFEQVDYAATYQSCSHALEQGHANLSQTVRLHVLCGISAAALEKEEEARGHFKIALALRPDLRLERDLSPKVRNPYLEAQGYWARFDERLSLKATGRESSGQLRLRVVDPTHSAFKVRIAIHARGWTQTQVSELDPTAVVSVRLTREQMELGFEYYAAALDSHENVLVELGTEAEPVEVQPRPLSRTEKQDRQNANTGVHPVALSKGNSHWLPVALVGSGLASAGVGVYFNVLRENSAHKWNGSGCEQQGLSRIDQCNSVNSDRINAERAAIRFYAASGLALASGIAIFALQVPSALTAKQAKLSRTTITCAAALPVAAVNCSGHF